MVGEEARTTVTRPKLLLADDSITTRKVVELTFADEGIDVTTAADAATAMEKFVQIEPDILLVDVDLPGTSGYLMCEMIKQDEATKHIPVLLLVGSFEPFNEDEAARVGADGFLTKPFTSKRELVDRVFALLPRADNGDAQAALGTGDEDKQTQPSAGAGSSEDTDVSVPGFHDPDTNDLQQPEADGDAMAGVLPEPAPATADIENLYEQSFADTPEAKEFGKIDDVLGDAGLDDELIEASYQYTADRGLEEPTGPAESAEMSKDFDWSPAVVEPHEGEPVTEAGFPAFETDIADDVQTDELRSADHAESFSEPAVFTNDEEPSGPETDEEPDHLGQDLPAPGRHDEAVIQESPFDAPAAQPEPLPPAAEPHYSQPQTHAFEPSPEFIDLVAKRVMEKLSDKVVREVARESVPRIAEKLIREALAEDKRS